jgi:hypothetical protein
MANNSSSLLTYPVQYLLIREVVSSCSLANRRAWVATTFDVEGRLLFCERGDDSLSRQGQGGEW